MKTILTIFLPVVLIAATALFALVSIAEGKTVAGPYFIERSKQPFSFWLTTFFPIISTVLFFSLAFAGLL